jgi:uncharacterized repeat protein (TIGR01451 family)
MKKKFYGAVVLFIAAAMIFSTVGIANTELKEGQIEISTTQKGSANPTLGPIVWDNGMEDWDGLAATQWDETIQFDCHVADDFHFEVDTEVFDVHWIGGYWNGDPAEFDWCISFFKDDGSGEAPVGTPYEPSHAGPFCFAWAELTVEDLGDGYYKLSVDLPESILFNACEKYWISIWGAGAYPPQSGWAYHQDPITLSPAVWGSNYFGFAFWTPSFDVQGFDHDQCFQLTEYQPCEPCIDVEKYVWDAGNQEWVDADTESTALDVPICDDVTFKIVVANCGDADITNIKITDKMHMSLKFISGDPEPDSVVQEGEDWIITWVFQGPVAPGETIEVYITAHVEGPECSTDYNYVTVEGQSCGNTVIDDDWCWVHAIKKSKSADHPFFAWLENHLNMFPLLQKLLKLIALF